MSAITGPLAPAATIFSSTKGACLVPEQPKNNKKKALPLHYIKRSYRKPSSSEMSLFDGSSTTSDTSSIDQRSSSEPSVAAAISRLDRPTAFSLPQTYPLLQTASSTSSSADSYTFIRLSAETIASASFILLISFLGIERFNNCVISPEPVREVFVQSSKAPARRITGTCVIRQDFSLFYSPQIISVDLEAFYVSEYQVRPESFPED